MKFGVIDIGSNSVRLMLSDGVSALYKKVKTTRLAEGMGSDLTLTFESMERTASAVSFFVEEAKNVGALKVFVFATAAVRKAVNKDEFTSCIKKLCGVEVDVVSGEVEANLGVIGALSGANGGVIDVGGASSEVIVVENSKKSYVKSIYVGAVSVTDACGQDKIVAKKYIEKAIEEYGEVPKTKFYGIGGTATSIAAIAQELEPYDPNAVDGYELTIDELKRITEKLYSMSIEDRARIKGLQPERAKVIANGAAILLAIMEKVNVEKITISEKDNLEGYLKYVMEKV